MLKLHEGLTLFNQFTPTLSLDAAPQTRQRFLLAKHADWELILMVWGPGAQTAIHDHNSSRCWTRILRGTLEESVFNADTLACVGEQTFCESAVAYIDDEKGPHRVRNPRSTSAMSLHLYAAPIRFCHNYDDATGLWVRTPVEHSSLPKEAHEILSAI